jgi:YVTN family beta-propeller protein
MNVRISVFARLTAVLSIVLAVMIIPALAQTDNQPGFHITQKIKVGGEGGWDYLTYNNHKLYVSHSDRVVVINTESGKVIGEIPKTDGVHGIAIANDVGKGYVSNGRSSTVSVFDLQSLKVVKEIPVGKNPDAILYDSFSKRVFAFNGRSNDASVIDVNTDAVIVTIPLAGKPEFSATDGAGKVFVNIEDKSQLTVIDSRKLAIIAEWPLAPGEEPSGLSIDVANRRLFSVCSNKMMVVLDADNGTVIASPSIGTGVDGCAFDPGTGFAFSSNGEGTMTVVKEVSPTQFVVQETVPTQRGARTITVDPESHAVYLPTAEYGPAPAPTADRPRPRPPVLPDSFVIRKLQR